MRSPNFRKRSRPTKENKKNINTQGQDKIERSEHNSTSQLSGLVIYSYSQGGGVECCGFVDYSQHALHNPFQVMLLSFMSQYNLRFDICEFVVLENFFFINKCTKQSRTSLIKNKVDSVSTAVSYNEQIQDICAEVNYQPSKKVHNSRKWELVHVQKLYIIMHGKDGELYVLCITTCHFAVIV